MKKGFVILSILLGFVLVASISYNISLYQENKALTAKQDSLYTLSEAQKVFKENCILSCLQCNRYFQPSNGFRKHNQSCNGESK